MATAGRIRSMNLRQLRYFAGIVEYGSFSKAADHLRVALSQHIRHMEEELGTALLHRSPRGVLPTEAGERLLRHAKTILAELAEIPDSVRGQHSALRGEVRFGLPGTVSEIIGVPLIEAARARYPGVRIRIVEAMSGYILDWLRRGEVDLAMIYSTSDPKGLAVHHGLSEEICLFGLPSLGRLPVPDGGEVTLAQAVELDLILPGLSHGLRDLVEQAALSVRVLVRPAIEIDSYGHIKRLAERGLGYGILPRTAVQKEATAGIFSTWRFIEPALDRKVYLAYLTERPLPTAVRAIGQLSWDILRQLVRDDIWTAELTDESHDPHLYGRHLDPGA
jgi:LysR family nitrogen assimilation transcriptional regulator